MGIGGGSGSGKSTIVNEIIEKIGPEKISVLHSLCLLQASTGINI